MSRGFDAIIIGAGQAGPPLAGRLTGAEMSVALIERHLFGGTCVNTSCMPTRTLAASAYAAHLARQGPDYGIMARCAGPHRHGPRQGARRRGLGRRAMSRVGRAIEKGETKGFMKVSLDAETRHILGAAILGTGGDEAIDGILDIMNAGAPYTALRRAVPIHPSVSELIPTMLGEMRRVR
jgi:pyruvate/2-oxoglutarate dehydrogenase complex dihydrolipoamide dehydrogenase (E3) component